MYKVGAWVVLLTILFGIVFLCLPYRAHADLGINPQIPFYGTLRNASGSLVDGNQDIVFRIYDAPTGGAVLWTGTYTSANSNPVDVTDGDFRVMLGEGAGNELMLDFNESEYYLGITIGIDTEMTPREQLGAVGYAFNTDFLDGLHAESFLRSDNPTSLEAESPTTLFTLDQAGDGNIMSVYNGTEEVLSILKNGNIGLGIIEPLYKLDVVGDSRFDGNMQIAEGSGIFLGSLDGGISFSQDSSTGLNNLMLGMHGSAVDGNYVGLVSKGSLRLVANADPLIEGEYPMLSLDEDGSARIVNTSYGDLENQYFEISFGSGARVTQGNLTIELGNVGIGVTEPEESLEVNGTILANAITVSGLVSADSFLTTSDERLKKNIRTIDSPLDTLFNLRGVRYEWKDSERFGVQTEIGFIAQEIQTVLPEVVHDNGTTLAIKIQNVVAVVVEALKELDTKVEEYFSRTERLEEEVADLRHEIDALRREIQGDTIVISEESSSEATPEETTIEEVPIKELTTISLEEVVEESPIEQIEYVE